MSLIGRIAALAFLFCATSLCAFDLKYGSWFTVSGINQENGVILLPVERQKYKNIKVLSKEVYDKLLTCKAACTYTTSEIKFTSTDYRKAFSNENMLIADVDFNGDWAITFLVFKNKDGYSVKTPGGFVFNDKKLQKDVTVYLQKLAGEIL